MRTKNHERNYEIKKSIKKAFFSLSNQTVKPYRLLTQTLPPRAHSVIILPWIDFVYITKNQTKWVLKNRSHKTFFFLFIIFLFHQPITYKNTLVKLETFNANVSKLQRQLNFLTDYLNSQYASKALDHFAYVSLDLSKYWNNQLIKALEHGWWCYMNECCV